MLSHNGYEVEERLVTETANLREMSALGFDAIPVVVVGERAFAGFPDEVLKRELGLPVTEPTRDDALVTLSTTEDILLATAAMVQALPDDIWPIRVLENRDRGLGQWAWHIFFLAAEFMQAIERGSLHWTDLRRAAETKYWSNMNEFLSFNAIGEYGRAIVEEIISWRRELDEYRLARLIETPWGTLSGYGLISHLERHSAVHLRQMIELIEKHLPDFTRYPSKDLMARIPTYASLRDD